MVNKFIAGAFSTNISSVRIALNYRNSEIKYQLDAIENLNAINIIAEIIPNVFWFLFFVYENHNHTTIIIIPSRQ